MMRIKMTGLVMVLALLVAACGSDDAADTTAGASGATVSVTSGELGEYLVDEAGLTLYVFLNDVQNSGASVCEGDCLAAWPPLEGAATAGDGADAGLLGTIERSDGSVQATYNGWPLYYFANDAAAGDTNGQGVNEVWYVVDGAGSVIN
jgi:predicted lipoprotein with Yx(FWY)xxD motif